MTNGVEEVVFENGVISFDGRVLECFGLGLASHPAYRMHVKNIERIELLQKKIVGTIFEVELRGSSNYGASIKADETQLAALRELIAKVEQERQA